MENIMLGKKLFSILIIILLLIPGILIIDPTKQFFNQASAESEWIQTSDLDFYQGTFDNVKVSGYGNNSSLRLSNYKNWIKQFPDNQPSGRSYSAMAPVWGTNKVVLTGGYESNPQSVETWIYNLEDNTWIQKSSLQPYVIIHGHAMASVYGTDFVLLFGGHNYYYHYSRETWKYSLNNDTWTLLDPHYPPPPGRRYHSMASVHGDDKVILFGGEGWDGGDIGFNDTWIFDLSQNRWTQMNQSYHPLPRSGHTISPIHNTDKFMLFGGSYLRNDTGNTNNSSEMKSHQRNDTWIYDLSKNNWTNVTKEIAPPIREGQAMASLGDSNKILMYGGFNGNLSISIKYLNDTWIFCNENTTWKKFNSQHHPPPVKGHSLATIYGAYELLYFGGENQTNVFNKTWIFRQYFDLVNGTFISSQFDTGANSSFSYISWDAYIPDQFQIKFRIRTGTTKSELNSKQFVGPDGTIFSSYIEITSRIWSGHKGDRFIQFEIKFETNNKNETALLKAIIVTYNQFPRSQLLNPDNSTAISNNKPKLTWMIVDDSNSQSAFQVLIDNDPSFTTPEYNSNKQASSNQEWQFPTGTKYDSIPNGIWYWKVRTQDSDGDWGAYSEPFKFILDTVQPQSRITHPKNNRSYEYLGIISGIAIDDYTGIDHVEISIKKHSDGNYWDGYDWVDEEKWLSTVGTSKWIYDSVSVSWASGEKYLISSRAVDNASNIEFPASEVDIFFDSSKPKTLISYPRNNGWLNGLVNITGKADDFNGSGISRVIITIKNNNTNEYWSGLIWSSETVWLKAIGNRSWYFNTSSIPWFEATEYIIRSRAYDFMGNKELPGSENKFRFDFKPPKKVNISINNGKKYTNFEQVSLLLDAKDSDSGVNQMAISINDTLVNNWETFSNFKNYFIPPGDGEKRIYFWVNDNANNTAGPVHDSIILDATAPSNLSIIINNGSKTTNTIKVNLTLSATDSTSGVHQMSFRSHGKNWSSWRPFSSASKYFLSFIDGEKTIYFRVKDRAGNVADPVSAKIKLNYSSSEPEEPEPEKDKPRSQQEPSDQINWVIGIIIFTIILILIIVILLFFKKKITVKELPIFKTFMAKRDRKPKIIETTFDKIDKPNEEQKESKLNQSSNKEK